MYRSITCPEMFLKYFIEWHCNLYAYIFINIQRMRYDIAKYTTISYDNVVICSGYFDFAMCCTTTKQIFVMKVDIQNFLFSNITKDDL